MTAAPSLHDLPTDAARLLAPPPAGAMQPAEMRYVRDEPTALPATPPDRWLAGTALRGAMLAFDGRDNLTAAGALDPDSVVLHTVDGRRLQRDRDYLLDDMWATLGRADGMPDPGPVRADYRYSLQRIDSLVRHRDGAVELIPGHSVLAAPRPPALPEGGELLANVWVPFMRAGQDCELFVPVEQPLAAESALALLPRTAQRLRRGGALRVVCWGDSITAGGEASSQYTTYPAVLERTLRHAYPAVDVSVRPVAVGGSSTRDWLAGGGLAGCDWQRVTDERPDLVTLEFVNDAGLAPDSWADLYAQVRARVQAAGAELLLTTPIPTMPAWMGRGTCHGADDRGYTAFLRVDASRHEVALADVSAHWQHLAEEGLPYISLLSNGINHPDDRGHALIARVLAGALGAAG